MVPARRILPLAALFASACGSPKPPEAAKVEGRDMQFARPSMQPPVFLDPQRKEKLAAAFPAIERYVADEVSRRGLPGVAVGIVIDGELVYAKGFGVTDVETKAPVDKDSVFRIASVTKSFTAMAILQLRDEGKLSLDDPAAKYVPELAGLRYPTRDAAPITLRQLLGHGAGFPEDNPWGDRQLGISEAEFSKMMREGFPFSTSPGSRFEYSNTGFAILGRVITNVSGMDYADYLRARILSPLGMNRTVLDERMVEKKHLARGYRKEGDTLVPEVNLPHGAYGAMGGLYSSLADMARYVAYHLAAWPPRDEREAGPVRRSTLREMHEIGRATGVWASPGLGDEPPSVRATGYTFGLGTFATCEFARGVSHTGGLPGYGSVIQFLPDYGVGVIAMSNLTYAPMWRIVREALRRLQETGALEPRAFVPSETLVRAKEATSRLVAKWSDAEADAIFADSLYLDKPRERWAADLGALRAAHGACREEGTFEAENALRGTFRLGCEKGWIGVSLTLAPTSPPRIQYLDFHSVLPPPSALASGGDKLVRLVNRWDDAAAAELFDGSVDLGRMKASLASLKEIRGACRIGDVIGGDGATRAGFRLACERYPVAVEITRKAGAEKIDGARFFPAPGEAGRCAQ
ncbi:serine hydrolase domain-containing protein [Polyangium sp. 15x6]|uniref:serine hydrolase domain-containing protein n=1 Tax=Polyangium sp. 15x6 TaxID=3042687 RepID=UPI00249A6870|nr:serine hydrolase domain-containing protein [Polyangium sp. 15x6]MDI3289483.1 serine hydrolase domain-containing protein [Polyangium sp. 15x6]